MNNDLSLGAVGAALITAIIALIGMVVAKENKTSEFRQEWINALRESIAEAISAVAAMNVISDLQFDVSNASLISETWRRVMKSLSLIELRLNVSEDDHKSLQQAIRDTEILIKRATEKEDVSDDLERIQDRITGIS